MHVYFGRENYLVNIEKLARSGVCRECPRHPDSNSRSNRGKHDLHEMNTRTARILDARSVDPCLQKRARGL